MHAFLVFPRFTYISSTVLVGLLDGIGIVSLSVAITIFVLRVGCIALLCFRPDFIFYDATSIGDAVTAVHACGCISIYTHLYYIPWFHVSKIPISVWGCPGFFWFCMVVFRFWQLRSMKGRRVRASLRRIPSLVNRQWIPNLNFLHSISPQIFKVLKTTGPSIDE